ncbi:hypothetical protein HBH52_147430 [Parastagonospora nodorum]|nr:hypothetical protein HBH52_147430 [Parastagonospora nodorum]
MACVSIGEANPDIAGLGILVAFVIQSVIAVNVSIYTFVLSSIIQQRWKDADPDPSPPSHFNSFPAWMRPWLELYSSISFSVFNSLLTSYASKPSTDDQKKHASHRRMAGRIWEWVVGKQPYHKRVRTEKSKIEDERTPTAMRLGFANRILLAGNDAQTFTGIALLISALVQAKTMSFYHMHILYDAISLVVISNCAASRCISSDGRLKRYTRQLLIVIWAILFITYFSVFAARLQSWDNNTPLHCYRTKNISYPGNKHPRADHAYIGVTFAYTVLSIATALWQSTGLQKRAQATQLRLLERVVAEMPKVATSRPGEMIIASLRGEILGLQTAYGIGADLVASDTENQILSLALLQCPLHIYSIFALRASNERYLDGGVSGSDWGFGQIVAIVLLGANFLSIADGITGYIE